MPSTSSLDATLAAGRPSFLDQVGSGLGRVAKFAEKNPQAIAMGLQGAGNLATADTENDYRRAQIASVEEQTAGSAEERRRRAAMEAALEPLRRALMGQMAGMQSRAPLPPNPYLNG